MTFRYPIKELPNGKLLSATIMTECSGPVYFLYPPVGLGGTADSISARPGLTIVESTNVGFLCLPLVLP